DVRAGAQPPDTGRPARREAARAAGDRRLLHPARAVSPARPVRRLAHRQGAQGRSADLHRRRQGPDRRGPPRRRPPRPPCARGARLLERDAARAHVDDRARDGHRRRAERGAQGDGREAGAQAVPALRGPVAARLPARARGRGAGALRRAPRAGGGELVSGGSALVDPERLARWMDERGLPGRGELVACRFITGGASNELFEVRRGEVRLALRRPPLRVPEGRNESMLRGYRVLPGIEEAAAWLRRYTPRSYRPGILHGDYQFANVMFRHGAPARMAAIVDWEMATIGDPLLDLGWVLMGWPDPDEERAHAGYV